MGYNVEFVIVAPEKGTRFPVPADAAGKLMKKVSALKAPAAVASVLRGMEGANDGPDGAIDYLGKGLSYARFSVRKDRVHVENNLNCAELLKVYDELSAVCPGLLILDLQNGQLHDAASYREWWAKPL